MPVHVGLPTKIEARFPIELLRRDILFCNGNMDCGNSLSLKLPDNAFNQINGQSLVLLIRLDVSPFFRPFYAVIAFAFTRSMALRMPAQTDRSVNSSTMLP